MFNCALSFADIVDSVEQRLTKKWSNYERRADEYEDEAKNGDEVDCCCHFLLLLPPAHPCRSRHQVIIITTLLITVNVYICEFDDSSNEPVSENSVDISAPIVSALQAPPTKAQVQAKWC